MMALKDTLGGLSVLTAPGATVWGEVEGFHCMVIIRPSIIFHIHLSDFMDFDFSLRPCVYLREIALWKY
jgi:hypothetical protein